MKQTLNHLIFLRDSLSLEIFNLSKCINNDDISKEEIDYATIQLKSMEAYYSCLEARINLLIKKIK